MRPNLFKYATSELSQDAFICWLMDWANNENYEFDRNLNLLAQTFVDVLIGKKLLNYNIVVGRQLKNIDAYAIINDTFFVIIEDKKGTEQHSNQLEKYSKYVKENKEWEYLELKLIYFKMEEQSNFSEIENANYRHFDREKMLKILSTYFESVPEKLQSHILIDFHCELKKLNNEIESFKHLPIPEWGYYSWMGFFHNLQKELQIFEPEWNYISNPSGGFLGFFWNWVKPNPNTPTFYLQIDQTRLFTFRLSSENIELNRAYRDVFKDNLHLFAEKNQIKLSNYGGKGKVGKTMGVLKLNEDFIINDKNGLIDFPATVDFIKNITKMMTDSVENMSHN